jgi:hypothetical protein
MKKILTVCALSSAFAVQSFGLTIKNQNDIALDQVFETETSSMNVASLSSKEMKETEGALHIALIGAGIGAGMGATVYMYQNWNQPSFSWTNAGVATLGGAVTGALTAVPINGLVGLSGGGAGGLVWRGNALVINQVLNRSIVTPSIEALRARLANIRIPGR